MPCKDDHGNNIVKAPPDLNIKKKNMNRGIVTKPVPEKEDNFFELRFKMEYLKFGTPGGKIVIGRDRRKYYEFNHKVTFPGSADGPFFHLKVVYWL